MYSGVSMWTHKWSQEAAGWKGTTNSATFTRQIHKWWVFYLFNIFNFLAIQRSETTKITYWRWFYFSQGNFNPQILILELRTLWLILRELSSFDGKPTASVCILALTAVSCDTVGKLASLSLSLFILKMGARIVPILLGCYENSVK